MILFHVSRPFSCGNHPRFCPRTPRLLSIRLLKNSDLKTTGPESLQQLGVVGLQDHRLDIKGVHQLASAL